MPNNEEFGILVHSFEKSRNKRIAIHVQEFKGSTFLSLREFYLKDDEWRPSLKGFTIRPELYPELLHGVITAAEALGVDPPEV